MENLIGADILSSGLGGLGGDPAATKLAALLPLGMTLGSITGGASQAAVPPAALGGAGLTDFFGSTALGGLLGGGAGHGAGPLDGVAGVIDGAVNAVGGLVSGLGAQHGTVLKNAVGVLGGDDPQAGLEGAVGQLGATIGHVGSGAASIVSNLGAVGDSPLASVLNATVSDFHVELENAADTSGLVFSLHGVTRATETLGLGHIGEDNLLSDVLGLPGALLGGQPIDLGGIVENAGHVVAALPDPVTGLIRDINVALGNGATEGVLGDVAQTVDQLGDSLGGVLRDNGPLHPVVDAVEGLLGGHDAGDPVGAGLLDSVSDTLAGLTGGGLGGGLLQPVTGVVDEILSGGLGGGHDPAGGLIETVTDTLGGLTGGDAGGLLQPVTDILDDVLGGGLGGGHDPAGGLIETVTDTLGGLTGGDAGGGLLQPVTDIVDDVLGGGLGGGHDPAGGLIETVTDTLGGLTGGDAGGGLLQPVFDTVDGVLGGLTGGDTLPLPAPGGGGLDGLVGIVGDVAHAVGGAFPEGGLINVDIDADVVLGSLIGGGCGCSHDQQPSSHLLDGLGLAA